MQLARAFRNFARIPLVETQTEPLEMKWDLSIDPVIFRLRLTVSEDWVLAAIIVGLEFAIVILKESCITSRIVKKNRSSMDHRWKYNESNRGRRVE